MPRHQHGRHTRGPRHLAGPGRASRSGRHLRPRRPGSASTPSPKQAMLLLTCAVALVGLLMSLPDATATTVISRFSPSADAYVSQTRPTANFGSAKELLAGSRPKVRLSYVRFEAVNLSGTVAKATVRFYSNDTSQAGFEVRPVTNSTWDEQTITYKTAPPPGPVVATAPQVPADAFTSVDITRLVTGGGVVNLAVTTTASRLRFASRESGELAPQLIVETTSTSNSTSSTSTSTTLAPTSTSTSTTLAPTSTSTSTTLGQTTTTLGPTTTTAAAPSPPGQGLASLTWAPPLLTNPVTYRISGTSTVITAAAGQDSVVRFAGPVNKRLILQGGRNWVIVGGEINIDRPWEKADDRNAILVEGATGVVHIEGVFMHGTYINDGIKACSPDAVFQIENDRIADLLGTQAGYHADVIQPYCGFKELRVDGLTGYSQFQGLMFKADGGSWRTTTLKRINLVGIAPQDGYPINVVTGCCNNDGKSYVTGPISLSDVYIRPSVSHNSGTLSGNICPAATFTFGTDSATGREYAEHKTGVSPQITGRIWKGSPPLGDYVPEGVTGVGYVAPSYL
jgi:hypothetical protein